MSELPIQADRDAAADFWSYMPTLSWADWQGSRMRDGTGDSGSVVQAFAAHRIASNTEAADLITEMQLAGFAVWNNVMEGDIEAHTEQASNALQMLREALAKAGQHG